MSFADVKRQNKNFQTNKKQNMRYWDEIDDIVYDAFSKIADGSTTNVNDFGVSNFNVGEEQGEKFYNELLSNGALPKVRDIIIKTLTEMGCTFPFVDENY